MAAAGRIKKYGASVRKSFLFAAAGAVCALVKPNPCRKLAVGRAAGEAALRGSV